MKEHQIEVNGIRLQVREDASESETIVFLHFSGGNLMMWEGVLPYFQNRYHLITLDLRGHGKSDSPKAGYHINQMAADVVGVMEQLGVQKAYIVGSSLGAEVGLSLPANYPEKHFCPSDQSMICLYCLSKPTGENPFIIPYANRSYSIKIYENFCIVGHFNVT